MKIYSMRVDSVHSEAYKVLGGINRAGREEDNGLDLLLLDLFIAKTIKNQTTLNF